jgi:two-component system response regulator YesN
VKQKIVQALREFDAGEFATAIDQIMLFYEKRPSQLVGALDAVSNVQYVLINTMDDGEQVLESIFTDEQHGYRRLYRLHTVHEVLDWLNQLKTGCSRILIQRHKDFKRRAVLQVQEYISENLDKRLTLNEVSAVFHLSPGYLSSLFAKHTNMGFVEYITKLRIEAAKNLLLSGNEKMYEIAQKLGFENALYFSKVFKKVVGVSPMQYIQSVAED